MNDIKSGKNLSKPNFICIGAQKAGTTWLSQMIERHPDVWIPPVKELHYFDYVHLKEMNIPKRRLESLKSAIDRKVTKRNVSIKHLNYLSKLALTENYDDEYYLSLFDMADKNVIGEFTPNYSMLPVNGVKHIKSLLGSVKIIFIMRNPIQRAWSFARMLARRRLEKGEEISVQAWMRIVDKPGNKKRTNYKETIEVYESVFDAEQILYLFYDDICYEPLKLLEKVCLFLEVDYDENLFSQFVKKRYNVNPAIDIPPKVLSFLQQEFGEQEEFVRNRFNLTRFEL